MAQTQEDKWSVITSFGGYMKAMVEVITKFLKLLFSMFAKNDTDVKLQEQKDRLKDKIKEVNEKIDEAKEQVDNAVSEYKEKLADVDQIKDQAKAKLDELNLKDPFDEWNERK